MIQPQKVELFSYTYTSQISKQLQPLPESSGSENRERKSEIIRVIINKPPLEHCLSVDPVFMGALSF